MSDNESNDNVIDDFLLPPPGRVVDEPPPPKRRRSSLFTATADDIEMMKRMFQALEKYTFIWQVPIGKRGPMQPNILDWKEIAIATTGNYDDAIVAKMKDWYKRTKKSIRYRISNGIKKFHISREALEADGEGALKTFYAYYNNFVFWPHVEYLTKYFIFQELGVDLDGIYTQREFYENGLPSTSEAAAQSATAGYNELLRGVSGFQQPRPWHELLPVPRLSQIAAPPVEETGHDPSGKTFGECQEQGDDPTGAMLDIKQEIFDTDMADQPEYNTSAIQNDATFVDKIKVEMNDDGTFRGNSLTCGHPLKHLDPTNKEVCSPPQPEQFGITQEEMDRRIKLYEKFQQYVKDKVQPRSKEEIIEFNRLFVKVSSVVSGLASIGKPPNEIAEQMEKLLIC